MKHSLLVVIVTLVSLAGVERPSWSQGIPLPGITLYGVIRNEDGVTRVTSGNLSLTYTPSGGGTPVNIQAPLADLPGGFSYVVNVPVEIPVIGLTSSQNALPLPGANASYTRSASVGGTNLNFVPGQESTTLSPDEHRGVVQRVDLQAGAPIAIPEDIDGDMNVDKDDLLLWFQAWMNTVPPEYNFDNQGEIDAADLLRMLKAIKADN